MHTARRCIRALCRLLLLCFFICTRATVVYTLSLHDALPIYLLLAARETRGIVARTGRGGQLSHRPCRRGQVDGRVEHLADGHRRSEEHTSELQSRGHLVCRLLLEKKNPTSLSSALRKASHSE